ncbi:MAG: hypothetical protein COW65_16030 [Cytophagales bacterium CG18_big_fil_WC_8_21_14_2_50_42_9]|nr:MAG: hypothetical protein COW65_16030 [Cytophagales bacterium CG18_big_fil_WC_8_21_14_2_50_42_9]
MFLKNILSCFCFLITGLFCLPVNGQAQTNLVPNGGFEENNGIPTEIGQFRLAYPWITFAPGNQPADYFNRAAKERTGVPLNFIGTQEPKTGDAYGGFLLYLNSRQEYTEFIQVSLTEALKAGEEYYAEFYVSLAEDSEFAVDGIGMHFAVRPPLVMQGGYAQLQPQVSNPTKNIILDKKNWVKISGQFKARGGERFLTIGNFKTRPANTVKKVKTDRAEKEPYKYAYYYLDEVTVRPVRSELVIAEEYFGDLAKNQPIILKNIFFAVDKATLLAESLPELDRLFALLQNKPDLRIALAGHTDNTNTVAYNQKLSEDRAGAVKVYLVQKGISPDRLSTKGYGNTRPIADNTTEAGKSKNRRVEFQVIR